MKKLVLSIILLVATFSVGLSQKYAFVDTKYILSEMPEYKAAQKELDDLSEKWQLEIEAKYKEISEKHKAYQEERILLPEEVKKQREQEIFEMEQSAKELQKKYFSVNGLLFQKRKELIEPIQETVYKAIKKMAKEKDYDFILDKGTNSNILFADPKYDKSDAILKEVKN